MNCEALGVKCPEHFFEPSPNELAALLIGSINLTRIKGIGIFMCNITVITLNKFGKWVVVYTYF